MSAESGRNAAAGPDEDQATREAFDTLLEQLDQSESVIEQVRALVLSSLNAQDIAAYVERVKAAAQKKGYVYTLAVYHAMRFWITYSADTPGAVRENEEARRIIRQVPDYQHTPGYLSILNNAVLGYTVLHDYMGAYRNAMEGLSLVDPAENCRTYCAFLNNTALILSDIGLHAKALRQLKCSMEYLPMQSPFNQVSTRFRYADALVQNGCLDQAQEQLEILLKHYSDIFPWQMYPVLVRIAFLRRDGGALDQWAGQMERALAGSSEPEGIDFQNVLFARAMAHTFHERYAEAEEVYRQIFRQGGAAMMGQYELLREAARMYEAWGKPYEAAPYYKQMDEMHGRAMALADQVLAFEDEAGGRQTFARANEAMYKHLRLLSSLGQQITSCLTYGAVREMLMREFQAICAFDALELIGLDEQTGHFYPAMQLDAARRRIEPWESYPAVARCVKERQSLHMSDVSGQEKTLPPFAKGKPPQSGSVMMEPILFQDQVLGVLCLHIAVAAFYGPEHQEATHTLCGSLGISFHIISQYQNAVLTSLMDPLTEIFNRAGLYQHEADLRLKNKGQLGLLLMDVDHFKQVNDAFGHEAGDQVLRMVGSFLKEWAAEGVAGRYGGDEFLVLLPAPDREWLEERAKELCRAARRQVVVLGVGRVTLSIGGCMVQKGQTLGAGVLNADAMLYLAKKNGRNQACIDGPAGNGS